MAEWKPIEELFDYEKGTLQSSKCTPGKYTFITAAEDWKTHNTFTHDCEALVFAMAASGSLGRTHYLKGKFISSDLCFILTPKKGLKLDLIFYHRLFNFLRADIVKKTATGTSKLAINRTNFGEYKLPYFDYDHQLSFRDKIEKIRGINEEFFNGMDSQILLLDKLRQAILQEAIEGKLTAQWRKEHPNLIGGENHASKLLEKIKAEKEHLIKEGKIKKEKPLPPITDAEKLFNLPNGWVWCRLGEVTLIERGISPEYCEDSQYRIINQKCVRWNYVDSQWTKAVLSNWFQNLDQSRLTSLGDILVNSTGEGTIGRAGIVRSENVGMPFDTHVLRIQHFLGMISAFVMYFINSTYGQNQVLNLKGAKTTKQTELGAGNLSSFVFPLAPIAEQKKIVEQIDKFIGLIGRLETQVSERKEQSEMLMRSVLREAFQ
jgi:type I restriction enzyme S subunit